MPRLGHASNHGVDATTDPHLGHAPNNGIEKATLIQANTVSRTLPKQRR